MYIHTVCTTYIYILTCYCMCVLQFVCVIVSLQGLCADCPGKRGSCHSSHCGAGGGVCVWGCEGAGLWDTRTGQTREKGKTRGNQAGMFIAAYTQVLEKVKPFLVRIYWWLYWYSLTDGDCHWRPGNMFDSVLPISHPSLLWCHYHGNWTSSAHLRNDER